MRYATISTTRKPQIINDELLTNNDKGRYTKGGLVRYAIFLNNYMTVISSLEKGNKHKNLRFTVALKDFDDLKHATTAEKFKYDWAVNYDSLISCRYNKSHESDDAESDKKYSDPTYILKNYIQQVPIEYYYVNTDQVTDDENIDYNNITIE
jgi:hypothetical protein